MAFLKDDKAFLKNGKAFLNNEGKWDLAKAIGYVDESYELTPDMLDGIAGGTLPKGWEKTVDQLFPIYKAKPEYANMSYEEACEAIRSFVSDPDDYAQICDYIQKYF